MSPAQKRNDRKEILRRLAMGSEYADHHPHQHPHKGDKPLRKPSLHSRLQGGMNLQICFMNETASDTESPSSDSETCPKLSKAPSFANRPAAAYNGQVANPYRARPLSVSVASAASKSPVTENGEWNGLTFT